MDKKFETIVFTTKPYRANLRDDSEYDKTAMWFDIADVMRILTAQGYQCRVYEEDFHIVVIEYNYKDKSYGGPTLEWVGEDEYICNPNDEVEYDERIKDDISPAVRGDILRCETEYDERNTIQSETFRPL